MGLFDPQAGPQRPFQIVTHLRSIAKIAVSGAQVNQGSGHSWMVWAIIALLDPQRPFQIVALLRSIAK
eukprot:2950123-Amphidinium_carterae.1